VDLDDLPQELKDDMTFVLADTMDDVLEAAMPPEFAERRSLHSEAEPDLAGALQEDEVSEDVVQDVPVIVGS
jgi:hypothetical protein